MAEKNYVLGGISFSMEENEINIEYEDIDVMPSCSFEEKLFLVGSFQPTLHENDDMIDAKATILSFINFAKDLHQVFCDANILFKLANESIMGLIYLKAAVEYSGEEWYGSNLPSHKCVIENTIKTLRNVCEHNPDELPLCKEGIKELERYVKTLSY